ncbi:MAG TPA: MXAN_6640 family putative metalloprotease [Anaerolineales bacterium]|nr:MXAN_6640 family putative metalloprotease [Anaerolineales bacterium]
MPPRRLFRASLLLVPFLLASLACNYVLSPFLPPTPTPTVPAIAALPRQGDDLRPPTATPTPTPTPTPTNTPEPTPTATSIHPTPTINPAALDDPDRPDLSGDVLIYGTEHFLIHYTFEGRDAVASTDDNGNGVPEYIEAVSEAMELSWQVEIVQLGWAAPPSDKGIGGDTRYDIYLEDIFDDGTAGFTDGGYRDTTVGDNPNTPAIETNASHSYISLDNDYREYSLLPPLDIMRVTAAHEFNHAIQFGYDSDEPANWLWEATATWMEDMVYDDINDQDYYLDAVFGSPHTCQVAEGKEGLDDGGHWYGMWIFLRYISEHYGNDAIRAIWESLATQDGYAALEMALTGVDADLDEVFRGFSVALLTRAFEEGIGYPTVLLKGEIEAGRSFSPLIGIAQMAADFIEIFGQGNVAITLQGLEHGLVVGLQDTEADIFRLQGGQISVDASQYEYLYLIVLNLSRAGRESDCQEVSYSILTGPGEQANLPDMTLNVPNFNPPRVKLLPDN